MHRLTQTQDALWKKKEENKMGITEKHTATRTLLRPVPIWYWPGIGSYWLRTPCGKNKENGNHRRRHHYKDTSQASTDLVLAWYWFVQTLDALWKKRKDKTMGITEKDHYKDTSQASTDLLLAWYHTRHSTGLYKLRMPCGLKKKWMSYS